MEHRKEQMSGQEDREITEREARAYRAKRNQKPIKRPELNREETKLFLQLVSQMANSVDFETKLGMKRSDVEYYKSKLDIEDYAEARRLLGRMNLDDAKVLDERIEENRRQAREAEAEAQQRLDAYERDQEEKRRERAQNQRLDASTIASEDAKRQRDFIDSQSSNVPTSDWRLPEVESPLKKDIIRRFQHELQSQGWNFCKTKYNVTATDLKAEAARLGIRINWDIVPR